MKRYLGVDLHRTQFTVCMRLEAAERICGSGRCGSCSHLLPN
jgi:uncharacterized low-complexity protein